MIVLALLATISFLVDVYRYYKVYNDDTKLASFAVASAFNCVIGCVIIILMWLQSKNSIFTVIDWIVRGIC